MVLRCSSINYKAILTVLIRKGPIFISTRRCSLSWFVVRAKPNQEFRANENLQNQGFETYLPKIQYKHRKYQEALFSGYLFLENKPAREPFSKIRSTRGVLSLVKFGAALAMADDRLIVELKRQELSYQNIERFKENDLVRVKSGPFTDLTGVYLSKSGEERAIILLRWLSRNNSIEIDEKHLEEA